MDKVNILGVKIDNVSLKEATEIVVGWLEEKGQKKHYIVTPNPEFLMLAENDKRFRSILNDSDLSIPDGSKLSWAASVNFEKTFVKRFSKWITFLLPSVSANKILKTTTGVDLMESLIKESAEKAFTIGLLGGRDKVAEKLKECLEHKYPKLKINFCSDGGIIDSEGNEVVRNNEERLKIKDSSINIPPLDILFVAFGQGKQEKWIAKNLTSSPVKVMMGVGGAFDYLSGNTPRAPKALRDLGLEWLFRLFLEPWRIKRQFSLLKFIFLVLNTKP